MTIFDILYGKEAGKRLMTPNKEDYLKCIHEIGERQDKITNKMIAEMMAVSAPSVSEMVKKLMAENLIEKDKETGCRLTDQGHMTVSQLYRKHRLIEVFLINHLNYGRQDIHDEAEVLEHTVTDKFIDRLDELLGFPKTCPHGGTIPRKHDKLIEEHRQLLSNTKEPGDYSIVRVYDNDLLLNYMEKHNLQLGLHVQLLSYDTFGQTWTIAFDEQTLTIPKPVAEQVFVKAKF